MKTEKVPNFIYLSEKLHRLRKFISERESMDLQKALQTKKHSSQALSMSIDVVMQTVQVTPTAFGDTTLTYNSSSQTVIYRYRRMSVPVTIVPATPSTPVVPTTPATPVLR